MKKNEIALLIFIVAIVGMVSYFVINSFLGNATNKPVKISTTTPMSASIDEPSETIFNKDAINPTVKVTIGGQANRQPFTINQ